MRNLGSPLPIGGGGTGAATAAAALTALGAQAALGFTPAQQGGGTGQGTNKVYIGWDGSSGFVRIQIDATDMGQVWCAAQAAIQTGTSGYVKFPNGFLIQWGTVSSGASDYTVSFPRAFASSCLGVLAFSNYNAGNAAAYSVNADGWTTSAASIRTRLLSGGSIANQTNLPVVYFAFGF